MENKVQPDHQQVLVRRCVSVRAACRPSRNWASAAWASRATAARAELEALFGSGGDGNCPGRRLVLHVLRRAQRTGDGFDLSRRLGRAEAEMAAADGAVRKDRLLRSRPSPWSAPEPAAALTTTAKREGDNVGPERPKALDRQRAVVRRVRSSGRATSPTTRSRASSSRTRPPPASASRRSSTRSRSRSSRTARSR